VFTGLRPGEKLHEELIVEGEDVSGTTHPKVMKLIGSEKMPPSWSKRLEELIMCAITGERCGVVERLDALVKGYRPDYEFHGVAVTDIFPEPAAKADLPPDPDLPSKSVH
jgi:FlaA1/EpsC-like NDP-sugar epimerase